MSCDLINGISLYASYASARTILIFWRSANSIASRISRSRTAVTNNGIFALEHRQHRLKPQIDAWAGRARRYSCACSKNASRAAILRS